jgi:hypothetical protein
MVLADPDLRAAYERISATREQAKLKELQTATLAEARTVWEKRGEASFADHVDTYDPQRKQMVLADPDLKAAYEQGVGKRIGIGQAAAAGVGVVKGSKEVAQGEVPGVARAVELLKLSKDEPTDPLRTLAIWLKINELEDGVKTAAESILAG